MFLSIASTMNWPSPSSLLMNPSQLVPRPLSPWTYRCEPILLSLSHQTKVRERLSPFGNFSSNPGHNSSIPPMDSHTFELTLWALLAMIGSIGFVGYSALYQPPWPSFTVLLTQHLIVHQFSVHIPSAPQRAGILTEGPSPIVPFAINRTLLHLSVVTKPMFILAAIVYAARECDGILQLQLHARLPNWLIWKTHRLL